MSKAKSLTLQRNAARAMKDAMHIGVDPQNANTMFGVCFANPLLVPRIKHRERQIAERRKAKKPRLYSRSHAIAEWEAYCNGDAPVETDKPHVHKFDWDGSQQCECGAKFF